MTSLFLRFIAFSYILRCKIIRIQLSNQVLEFNFKRGYKQRNVRRSPKASSPDNLFMYMKTLNEKVIFRWEFQGRDLSRQTTN